MQAGRKLDQRLVTLGLEAGRQGKLSLLKLMGLGFRVLNFNFDYSLKRSLKELVFACNIQVDLERGFW